jgi:hypothetical protein
VPPWIAHAAGRLGWSLPPPFSPSPFLRRCTQSPQGQAVIGTTGIAYGEHVPLVNYPVDTDNWRVFLDPDPPEYLRGAPTNYADVLSAAFPVADGWSYQSAANELSDNSLVVRDYIARHGAGLVGAEFLVEYVPHAGDPGPLDVHWIQVIRSNHRLGANHGTAENVVDHVFARSPYYDHGGLASSRFFYDFPKREHENEHVWEGVLFLVTGPAVIAQPDNTRRPTPGAVTLLGGIRWGWQNECISVDISIDCDTVPEPAAVPLLALALGMAIWWRRRT